MKSHYGLNVKQILESNKDYLKIREKEVFCDEHGLCRYSRLIFQGCFMCPADRDIQDQIIKANILHYLEQIRENVNPN